MKLTQTLLKSFGMASQFWREYVELVPMLIRAAQVLSDLNPKFQEQNGEKGLFALSPLHWREICRRMTWNDETSPFDTMANAIGASMYLRWAFDEYTEYFPDPQERFIAAVLAITHGFIKVRQTAKSIIEPRDTIRLAKLLDKRAEKIVKEMKK